MRLLLLQCAAIGGCIASHSEDGLEGASLMQSTRGMAQPLGKVIVDSGGLPSSDEVASIEGGPDFALQEAYEQEVVMAQLQLRETHNISGPVPGCMTSNVDGLHPRVQIYFKLPTDHAWAGQHTELPADRCECEPRGRTTEERLQMCIDMLYGKHGLGDKFVAAEYYEDFPHAPNRACNLYYPSNSYPLPTPHGLNLGHDFGCGGMKLPQYVSRCRYHGGTPGLTNIAVRKEASSNTRKGWSLVKDCSAVDDPGSSWQDIPSNYVMPVTTTTTTACPEQANAAPDGWGTCASVKQYGWCTDQGWRPTMETYCATTCACDLITTTTTTVCADEESFYGTDNDPQQQYYPCPGFEAQGYCSREDIRAQCKKTCGVCQ